MIEARRRNIKPSMVKLHEGCRLSDRAGADTGVFNAGLCIQERRGETELSTMQMSTVSPQGSESG